MVGMKDKSHIKGVLGFSDGLLAGQHPEEIACVAKSRVGSYDLLAFADAVKGSDDGRDLRR